MKNIIACITLALALPGAAVAATRTYDARGFDSVSVAAGITVDISLGSTHSVVADTSAKGFDDLQIEVDGKQLRIGRPKRSWFAFGKRVAYHVQVVTPALHSLAASSGSQVRVKGTLEGNFAVEASSGSEVEVSLVKGAAVRAEASSGSELTISGSCQSLDAASSSGAELDAEDLQCEQVAVQASSGSELVVGASQSVTGSASSGADVRVRGNPPVVKVDKSSGADVVVKN